jgi:hypothetical protein
VEAKHPNRVLCLFYVRLHGITEKGNESDATNNIKQVNQTAA